MIEVHGNRSVGDLIVMNSPWSEHTTKVSLTRLHDHDDSTQVYELRFQERGQEKEIAIKLDLTGLYILISALNGFFGGEK